MTLIQRLAINELAEAFPEKPWGCSPAPDCWHHVETIEIDGIQVPYTGSLSWEDATGVYNDRIIRGLYGPQFPTVRYTYADEHYGECV